MTEHTHHAVYRGCCSLGGADPSERSVKRTEHLYVLMRREVRSMKQSSRHDKPVTSWLWPHAGGTQGHVAPGIRGYFHQHNKWEPFNKYLLARGLPELTELVGKS